MIELFLLVLLAGHSYFFGKRTLKLMGYVFRKPSEAILLSIVFGFGLYALILYLFGVMGLLHPWLIRVLFSVSLVTMLFAVGKQEYLWLKTSLKSIRFKLNLCIWLVIAVAMVNSLVYLLRCLTPVLNMDSLYVYLHHAKLFVQNHALYDIDYGGIAASYRPLNVIMLNSLGILLYSDILSQLISGWFMGVLCALAVYSIARNMVSRKIALLSAVIFYAIPSLSWLMHSTKVDLGTTAFELCFWVLFFKWLQSLDKKYLLCSAFFLGIAMGSKYHSVLTLSFASMVAFVVLCYRTRKFWRSALMIAIFSLFSLLIASPSYIRSFILVGDPIYPFMTQSSVSEAIITDDPIASNGLIDYIATQFHLIFGRYINLESYSFHDKEIGFLFALFIPFVVFSREAIKKYGMLISITLMFYLFSSYACFRTSETFPRHFLPAIGLVSCINGYGIKLALKLINKPIVWTALIVVLLSISVFSNIGYGESSRSALNLQTRYVIGAVSKEQYLQNTIFRNELYMNSGMTAYLNQMNKETRIMAIDEMPGYYVDVPMIQRRELYSISNRDSLYAQLGKYDASHIFYSQDRMDFQMDRYGREFYDLVKEEIAMGRFVLETQFDDQYLYKLLQNHIK